MCDVGVAEGRELEAEDDGAGQEVVDVDDWGGKDADDEGEYSASGACDNDMDCDEETEVVEVGVT